MTNLLGYDIRAEFMLGRERKISPKNTLCFGDDEGFYSGIYYLNPSQLVRVSTVKSFGGDYTMLSFELNKPVMELVQESKAPTGLLRN